MTDYYEVLGVRCNASAREIKSSFRRLVHKHHPDRNPPQREMQAAETTRLLLEAYGVLSNEAKRTAYDRRRQIAGALKGDPYRARLVSGKHHRHLRASLILYDLLGGRPDDALTNFEEGILQNGDFRLADFLPLRDWLDCTVLLAEQYHRRKQHTWALSLYEEVYRCAQARKRYGDFFFEIRDRIRDLCCRVLAKDASAEEAVGYYARALRLDLEPPRAAYVHKKMAECYLRAGRPDEARAALRAAFDVQPRMKGAARLCQRLGFQPGGAAKCSAS